MLNFKYYSPTSVIFGRDSVDKLGTQISSEVKTVLFHYGGGSIKRSGLYDQVQTILTEKKVKVVELGGVEPNPKLTLVREGIALCREHQVDLILAVGGGSVIDSAKAIGIGVNYEGDVWDFFMGKAQPGSCVPIGVILTIPATGSETSPNSVVTKEEGLMKRGVKSDLIRPSFAILNPELTLTLPEEQTFAGIMDILSHVFERYFTTTTPVDVTDLMCEGVMKATIENAYKLRSNPNDYDARAEIMLAGTVAHNGILGVGRLEDWASHRIAHEITALYGTTHGVTLGIIFPAWMKYVSAERPDKFVQFAQRVFGVSPEAFNAPAEIANEGIRRFEAFLSDMGLPKSFGEAALPADQLDLMTEKATLFGSLGGYKKLEAADVKAIYKMAL
ncbi:iron-containing alcohol dehydrogenase [Acidaminobacter sp.]|uniref:iron-containing alcohol dehydrogenase n=1 Tax=Acidaminobacter sp. TaxID=1872102 RepID=UPI00137D8F32|nr:iron-containing alcohol dehydrogenase [Acidaminobacter sp.]MDK9710019.1 iron-containing alcohol dehydrogenase [Acidaminobacter sp.]MZQ98091.1 iron-containing alcohol dehydrogenase [Acidaminobacter sp.]